MASFAPFIAQLRRLWSRLGRGQQMALIGVAGGALVFAFIFLNMGNKQTFVTAFTNLDPKDSAAAAEQLKADKIPYEVTPDGGTIKVTPDKLADARLKLAAKGLPQGGAVGFELFDKTSFGITDFAQQINYQRALEGELSRTINTLAQVEGSRVHIVVPKEELFASQQKPATASVVLRLRAGRTIDEGGLRGISYMIARSVSGLDPKNISILDTSGRTLFDGGSQDTAAGLSSTQLEMQVKLEKGVEDQVQTLLDRVAGPNRAAVRVKADMDFSQQEELAETFTPGGPTNQGVARSSATVQETFNGNGQQQTAGQPGAIANIPGAAAQTAQQGGNSQYQRQETTTNYEVSKSTKKTVTGPGQIKRLNVSVILDSTITEADAAGLRGAVAAAAGIDEKRGDQLVVTTAAFSANQNVDVAPVMAPKSPTAMLEQYGKMAIPFVAAVIVLFFVWRMSRSVTPRLAKVKLVPAPRLEFAGAGAPLGAAADVPLLTQRANGGGIGEPAQFKTLPDPVRKETAEQAARRQEIQDRMTNLATANPEAVAEIIHSWMSQDDRKK
ncbi:MAG: flagellar M-ring protein FliF [Chloroflexi bacterium]|nr:flagellar M-ring protein FliF [Chloroflexota bacterium]